MICIDVGCARYGGDFSIEWLIEEFHPDLIYGFDPAWQRDMYEAKPDVQTVVIASNEAAWTYDGKVRFKVDGLGGHLTSHGRATPCIDLARFISELPEDEIVLKIDAEGSEYPLLDHIIERKVDGRLRLAWIEWHDFGVPYPEARRRAIERSIGCDLTEWHH